MVQDILPFFIFPTGSLGTEQQDNKKYIFFNNTRTHTGGRSRLLLLAESLTNHSVQTHEGILTFHLFIYFYCDPCRVGCKLLYYRNKWSLGDCFINF